MKPQAIAFYKSFFDNMADGLAYGQAIFDERKCPIDFICLKVNNNFEKLLGLKNVVGKKASQAMSGIIAANPELLEIFGRVSLTAKPEKFETYIKPLAKWFFISAYSPKKNFFVAIFQDFTGQRQTEESLKRAMVAAQNVLEDLTIEKSKVEVAEAKEEAILLSIGDGLVATDEKGNIILINNAAEKLLGKKSEEVVGKAFAETLSIEDEKGAPIPPEKRPMGMALATGATTTTTNVAGPVYYYMRKDKTKFPAAITVTPVILGKKIIGAIEVFRDATKEKEIDQAKSEFISLASHQLKTPPTAIKLLTERLLGGGMGTFTKKQKEYFSDIRSLNQRMIDLVNALLSVSRIELGAFIIQTREKDVCAIVLDILDELKFIINKKSQKLKTILPEKNPVLLLDESLFRMVINNLITNAIDYTAEGGEIQVECKIIKKQTIGGKFLDGSYFVVVISDTGYGIPRDQQDKVFTKFFRADNAREKHADGTGLGLYLAKSILDHSGGSIWFTSRENEGSVFYTAIPMTGMKVNSGEKGPIGLQG